MKTTGFIQQAGTASYAKAAIVSRLSTRATMVVEMVDNQFMV